MAKLNKILVPTDFSEAACRAVDYAMRLAEVNHAEIHLMTVIGDLPLTDEEMVMLRVSLDSVREYNKKQIDAARAKLEAVVSPELLKRLNVQFIVRDGTPFVEIIRAAKELSADLIVIASHGSHGIKEMLLGSTTDRIVNKAPCSVLVVRENQHAFEMP